MNLYTFILFTCIIVFNYRTSSGQYLPGAKQISLAHADIAAVSDIFASFSNPAGLSNIKSFQIGIYYSPSPFGLKQLSNAYCGIANNFGVGTFSICYSSYGFQLYKENKISISYGCEIYNNFRIGISVYNNSLSIQNYGQDNSFFLTFGTSAKITELIYFGFSIVNAARSTLGKENNQIPSTYTTGLSAYIIPQFVFHIAIEKEIEKSYSLNLGLEYNPLESVGIRFGIKNNPAIYSGGIGINYSFITIDYSLFTHLDLGLTHQAALLVNF